MQQSVDTVCCLLYQAVIGYHDVDPASFTNHMRREHQITCNTDFLLVACLMDKEEREAVQGVIESKQKELEEKTLKENQMNQQGIILMKTEEKIVEETQYKCDVCQKSCANEMYLKKHKMIHVQCEVCEKTYYNSTSLKKHMVIHNV